MKRAILSPLKSKDGAEFRWMITTILVIITKRAKGPSSLIKKWRGGLF
jgi:hypothetical protein